jgi:hypothetical protein
VILEQPADAVAKEPVVLDDHQAYGGRQRHLMYVH